MWRDICISNREALGEVLRNFSDEMVELAHTIRRADGDHLLRVFERAKAARDRYVDGIAPRNGAETDRE
jgi:prephenate dehydrogenase